MSLAKYKLSPASVIILISFLAAILWVAQAWWSWAHFDYRTFDLAFYVQALDGFSHGRCWSSLLGVNPFGNHADVVILLIWPFYTIFQHPMVPVVMQNVALAACVPLAWRIASRFGWSERSSCLLAMIFVANPILTYVARHEFHPEAFAAPLFLAIYDAWQQRKLGWFWVWTIIFLSCKENLGLMMLAWIGVKALSRGDGRPFWIWKGLPALYTVAWMGIYLFWLGPKWNQGNVDFGGLYAHFREQGLITGTSWILKQSLQGNLLWTLLLPTLLIPLRRPWTLLPALPILLQHLLSWRSSEWTIFFHYGAPLLPIFWLATMESFPDVSSYWKERFAFLLLGANLVFFFAVGTPNDFWRPFKKGDSAIAIKKEALTRVPGQASVTSSLGFQSHLAQREELYSLHLIMKGLKTLSRQTYVPPRPTDVVIVDYADSATFDQFSGYYHPTMKLTNGTIVQSSDKLFHNFLRQESWTSWSKGSVTVFTKTAQPAASIESSKSPLLEKVVDPKTDLISIVARPGEHGWQIVSKWSFRGERERFPWLNISAVNLATGERRMFTRGLCCPDAFDVGVTHSDIWDTGESLPGKREQWQLTAVFEDFASRDRPTRPPFSVANIPWEK